ncbi:hypothetical protein P8452_00584 [Trifolium repens]|nr:hypothetical protein P8452_00584 [Trifolium repens]
MEVPDENGKHTVDENEEENLNDTAEEEVPDENGKHTADNDSCHVDLEANVSQEPYIGMKFDSQENAYSFYTHYAKCVGFGISIKNSRRSKVSREFIDAIYACTRYGKKRESTAQNPRPCLKVECEASLRIKRNCEGKWIVHSFIKDHNHELFPAYAHYFPCHRGINKAQKHAIETLQHAIELLEEGSLSFESYDVAFHALEETLKQCAAINKSLKLSKEKVGQNSFHEKSLRDPQPSKTKGAPTKRMKSGIEKGRKRTSSVKVKKV